MRYKHILVVSYPRSGTHLTIDLIRNNFDSFRSAYISFMGLRKEITIKKQVSLLSRISNSTRVFKAHIMPNNFEKEATTNNILRYIKSNSVILYIVRDGRDVMVSQYCRWILENNEKKLSFSEFIRNPVFFENIFGSRPNLWAQHLNAWLYGSWSFFKPTIIHYEDLLANPKQQVSCVSYLINQKINGDFIDMRLKNISNINSTKRNSNGYIKPNTIGITSVHFRNGKIGDYKNFFTHKDLDFFYYEVESVLNSTVIKSFLKDCFY